MAIPCRKCPVSVAFAKALRGNSLQYWQSAIHNAHDTGCGYLCTNTPLSRRFVPNGYTPNGLIKIHLKRTGYTRKKIWKPLPANRIFAMQ